MLAGGIFIEQPDLASHDPADVVELIDLQRRVRGALSALQKGHRDAALLYYVEGLTPSTKQAGDFGLIVRHRSLESMVERDNPVNDSRAVPKTEEEQAIGIGDSGGYEVINPGLSVPRSGGCPGTPVDHRE